ncbi:PAS/PAC sensor-containing diguanylate cyclase/phosphodiesterase, partial [Methylophaga lonarensis MPL]
SVLESMAHQLKQGQLKLSNPLTGDTAQQQLAETLVETGAQLEQQILQIREKEQRLSITLDSIGDAVIVTDKEGKVIRMNSKAEQMTGWQQQDAYGQALPQVFDIANASSGETISNPVEQVFATGNVVELANHTLLKSRTGQTYHISDSAAPIRDKWLENGSIQGVILVFQDVTTQYALREKLRETAEFLQNLMRISPSVTYVFDIVDDASNPFRLSYVSESVKNHSGLDSDYWLSDQAVWTEHLSADELDELQKALNRLRKNGGSEAHELRYRHRDGHYVTVQNHMVAVENQKGEIDKIICNSVDVSAQKKAQANSVWLGDILERSLNEIYVFDSKTLMFTLVNKGARENLGYSQEELACLTPLDLKHEFTEREFKQMIEPLLTGLKPRLRFETFHYRKDGTRYPVRVDLQLDNRGEQARFVALVEDTSEIQQQQQELQEERSLLRRIIDSSPDLIFCKDTNGVFIRCNKAFENYFGHPESEIIGKTDADFVDKDTAELFVRNDQLALQKNHSHINQEWIRYPDGRSALLETLKTPLRSPSGEIVGLLGISRDITLQRQAEQEQQLAAMVFRCGQEAVMITDANNNIIKVNPAFSSCTGYDEKEVLGKNPRLLSSGAQDAAFYEMMWQSLKQNNVWSGEIWNRRKNGDIYLQWLSISMVHDSHGKLINHVAIMSDITKFREAENTISFLAQHDALTRLPNRSMLKDRVRQAMISAERHGQKLALMYLDLDRFT